MGGLRDLIRRRNAAGYLLDFRRETKIGLFRWLEEGTEGRGTAEDSGDEVDE
jgi:hypothetical protein